MLGVRSICLLLALPLAAAEPQTAALHQHLRDGEGRLLAVIDWPGRQLRAIGRARGAPGVPTSRLERAAVADAYANLAAAARAARIDAERTVDSLLAEPGVPPYLSAYIRGAAVGALRREADGWVAIDASLPLYGVLEGDLPALGPYLYRRDDVWAAEVTPGPASDEFTGVRFDARGLDLAGGFAPTVRDEDGRLVWHIECAEREQVEAAGAVEYRLADQTPAQPREGDRPLVVRLLRVSGGCDMVVSLADGERLAPRRLGRGGLVFASLGWVRTITPVSPFRAAAVIGGDADAADDGEGP